MVSNYLKKLNLQALDVFMSECGDATDYTVSQCFTISELFALKQFTYKHDVVPMPQMAYQRYEKIG